jgi:hypothetical protein
MGIPCTIMTKYRNSVHSAGLTTNERATSCKHDTGHWLHSAPGGHLNIQRNTQVVHPTPRAAPAARVAGVQLHVPDLS